MAFRSRKLQAICNRYNITKRTNDLRMKQLVSQFEDAYMDYEKKSKRVSRVNNSNNSSYNERAIASSEYNASTKDLRVAIANLNQYRAQLGLEVFNFLNIYYFN